MNREMKKIILIFMFIVNIYGNTNQSNNNEMITNENSTSNWSTYTSIAGFYSLKYPSSWKITNENNIVNVFPDGESGSVTISSYYGEAPIPNFMNK
jgi:hypothetical protein